MHTKNRLLEIFEANKGLPISGVQLAKELSVSRNAIWKAIQTLREDGYAITAAINKGYCLAADSDVLSAEGIRPFLHCDKHINGQNIPIMVYPSLSSTNQTAKELAVANATHGTVVISNCQSDGKGRYGRAFFSPSGSGLYMSIIWKPDNPNILPPTAITAFAAVCVCEAIAAITGQEPSIKWVNDLFLNGKKVCGILTEAVTDFESHRLQWAVIGIGINIAAPPEGFPPALQSVAGALYSTNPPPIRCRLAAEIINRILCDTRPDANAIFAAYRERLFILGKRLAVTDINETYNAVALDIDGTGRLLVQTDNGEQRTLSSGEVQLHAL